MPDFVAMDLGPDRIGMTQLFAGELQRAGFNVTSVAQAQKLMTPVSQLPGHADTALELYQMLDNIRKVDPSALPMKVRHMKKLARKSGVGNLQLLHHGGYGRGHPPRRAHDVAGQPHRHCPRLRSAGRR